MACGSLLCAAYRSPSEHISRIVVNTGSCHCSASCVANATSSAITSSCCGVSSSQGFFIVFSLTTPTSAISRGHRRQLPRTARATRSGKPGTPATAASSGPKPEAEQPCADHDGGKQQQVDERIPIGLIGHNRRVLLIQGLSVRGLLEALGGPALHAADLPSEASLSARLSKAAHARYLPLSWNGIYRQSQRSVNKWSNNYAGERCNDHRHEHRVDDEHRVDGVHRCPPIGCGQGGA